MRAHPAIPEAGRDGLTGRRPLRGSVVPRLTLAVTVATAGLTLVACGAAVSTRGSAVPTTFPAEQGQPFAEPPELRARRGVLRARLRVAETRFTVAGRRLLGKSYNGSFIGPTLRVRPGDRIEFDLVNRLDEPTNIHFHGFHVSPAGISDNVLRTIRARTTGKVVVRTPRDMAPGTYWYHSHLHGDSEEQVMDGLSGVVVVDGLTDRLPRSSRRVASRTFAPRTSRCAATRSARATSTATSPRRGR